MILDEIKQIMLDNREKIFYDDITYGKLYKYVSRLSSYLESLEKENQRIMIYGHKDIMYIISMLSCAYTGITYIPVDISFSKERINDIIEISKPDVIINITDEIVFYDNIKVLEKEKIEEIIYNDFIEEKELTPKIKAEDVYYIIFTSGSTGKPKGVKIKYKNLDYFCDKIIRKIVIKNGSVILNQALFSFDLSVADIYMTLLSASRYVMLSSDEIKDYPKLYNKIKENNVEVIVSTPSFIDYLLIDKDFNRDNIKKLNTIFTCGEILSHKTVKKIKSRFSDLKFINSYGPTECTVAATSINVDENMDIIPAGSIKDETFCIVDDNLNPIGGKGNILIYGELVTDGYVNYPNDAFVEFEGKKAYITGDIGYLENENLYYISRKDRQVKLNGYRIELGEIEAKISSVESVEKCAVIEKKNEEGKVIKIIAYVITSDTNNTLKQKLKDIISSYMFPEIKIVKELPVNDNYKIDLKRMRDEENEG